MSQATPAKKFYELAGPVGHGRDDHDRLGNRRLIRQRDIEARHHPSRRDLPETAKRTTGQPQGWLSRRPVDHTQVTPEHALSKARAECLRAGFLGRDAAGIARRPVSTPLAFPALHIRKYAVEKTISESLDYPFDAADVDQMPARPDEPRGSRAAGISRALFRPS